jgi:L-cysteine S-thiosulfotransferase
MVQQHHGRRVLLSWPEQTSGGMRWRVYALALGIVAAVPAAVTPGGTASGSDTLVAYHIVNGAIPEPLTVQPGDPERGRRVVLDRDGGDCPVCHAMPLPERQFHGTVGPPLDGIGSRSSAGVLRLRLVDPKAINPETIMPAYYKVEGLHRVLERYRERPILTAQQIEDVIAYLLTLTQE